MKKLAALLTVLLFCAAIVHAQSIQNDRLPNVQVKDLNGKLVNVNSFSNNNKPIVVSFWATWCKPCITELEAIADEYGDWQNSSGVKIIAVSIDDARTSAGIKSLVSSRGWPYEIYNDYNKDLYRALGIANVPYTLVLNGEGKIVERHAGYNPGDEHHLLDVVRKLATGR
ncbi:MAG TPA: TlpA disulfide reductase family protein [Chitinophaga sp.]|uniref:TlpA family protein disulfide reductase n=1 Tax=Chitinophaga sp. TaxID=1869181 RepID=UPI002D1A646E|nr:TlpA disulfide reductase family protein [Chitinophaga sp.]HVI44204.1 TlpA disulfide reductase family protein [Chitinophaga sp.]